MSEGKQETVEGKEKKKDKFFSLFEKIVNYKPAPEKETVCEKKDK